MGLTSASGRHRLHACKPQEDRSLLLLQTELILITAYMKLFGLTGAQDSGKGGSRPQAAEPSQHSLAAGLLQVQGPHMHCHGVCRADHSGVPQGAAAWAGQPANKADHMAARQGTAVYAQSEGTNPPPTQPLLHHLLCRQTVT